ncbi:hypothetical protein [Rhodoferax sp.]|uniref:hypothetical protein n=1 Tax=Rhodoferax sp. TaxID=50421 RepID=UPI0026115040|nr:hypothetical protein [Rhodoferax sp.]MDD5479528.1 hypothetical protein [Rhodoferax sp.]
MNVTASKTASIQPTQRPTQIQQSEQKADMAAKHAEPENKKSAPTQSTPVVNTQGQTTGRLLNVTA